jgi:hypothetical protein
VVTIPTTHPTLRAVQGSEISAAVAVAAAAAVVAVAAAVVVTVMIVLAIAATESDILCTVRM